VSAPRLAGDRGASANLRSREGERHSLALVGSLRRASYNRMTHRAPVSLAPPGLTFEEADIGSLPLYDDDLRVQQGYPPPPPPTRLRELDAASA
jgi:NAD(P)H-dependent FMN reductase